MTLLNHIFKEERNKTLFLLIIMLVHNLIYPMSTNGGIQPIIFYVIFSTMFIFGVFLLSTNRIERIVIVVSGIIVFVSGVVNAYMPGTIALPILYISAFVYHVTMAVTLFRYIFAARRVLIEVILAATSLYLVIGSLFTTIFGLIEWLEPGSFVASSGAEIGWQNLLYYSYVTLTTLGYGDITPVRYYAQSLAAFEAIFGVLYTVILLSRLVSVYETGKDVSGPEPQSR